MSMELHTAGSLERLAAMLADRLREGDPFHLPPVAVPNPALRRALKLHLARRWGIAANLNLVTIEEALQSLMESLLPGPSRPSISQEGLAMRLIGILPGLEHGPAARYLAGEDGSPSPKRLFQLAHRLAGLFLAYEDARPETSQHPSLVKAWLQGVDCFVPRMRENRDRVTAASIEGWQRDLYRRVFTSQSGILSPADSPCSLAQVFAAWLARDPEALDAPGASHNSSELHVFGYTHLSATSRSLLWLISKKKGVRVHAYLADPGTGMWCDELALENLSGEASGASDEDLLAQWGTQGAKSLKQWYQMVDYDLDRQEREEFPDTVLGRLQEAISRRHLPDHGGDNRRDGTLRILACPGRMREVESVHQAIVGDLSADPELNASEIAVYVTDMDLYQPLLETVFARHEAGDGRRVPHVFADTTAKRGSRYADAVRNLLKLATLATLPGGFSRPEVFGLLSNPCFRARFGVDGMELERWLHWVDRLHIYHGFDEADNIHERRFSWRWGMRRLAWSTVAEEITSGDGQLALDIRVSSGEERESLAKLLSCLEIVHSEATRLSACSEGGPGGWLEVLSGACRRLLDVPSDAPIEQKVASKWLRDLARLRDEAFDTDFRDWDAVQIRAMSELVGEYLDKASIGGSGFLTDGVNLCSLLPMRALEFRVVYVLGLEEGRFPGEESRSTLDLRNLQPSADDTSPTGVNRYTLLETLMAVKERIVLSYPDREPGEEKPYQPCAPLLELLRTVGAFFGSGPSDWVERPPLNSLDESLFAWKGGGTEAFSNRYRDEWESMRQLQRPSEHGSQAIRSIQKENSSSGGARRRGPPEQPARFLLRDVQSFLKDPLSFRLERRLGLSSREELDVTLRDQEPSRLEFPDDWRFGFEGLQNIAFATFLHRFVPDAGYRGPDGLDETVRGELESLYDALGPTGAAPSGVLGEMERANRLGSLLSSLGPMSQCVDQMEELGLRRALTGAPEFEIPFSLSNGRQVLLAGEFPWIVATEEGGSSPRLGLVQCVPGKLKPEHQISARLMYLVGQCLDDARGELFRRSRLHAWSVSQDGNAWKLHALLEMEPDPEKARSELTRLLDSMLEDGDLRRFPLAWMAGALKRNARGAPAYLRCAGTSLEAVLRDSLEADDCSEEVRPGRDFTRLVTPLLPEDPEALWRLRLEAFFPMEGT